MFNISTFAYEFVDATIYCVGESDAMNLFYQYYKIHKGGLNPQRFTERIIYSKIYAYEEGKTRKAISRCKKFNSQLQEAGLLMDINYYEEAMLIEQPVKIIEVLELQELYNNNIEISNYWRERFPTLPESFIITPES